MIKMNNKGFAVSTILYGILSLTILILLLIFGVMKSNKDMNAGLVESLTDSMNKCAVLEIKLENCYLNGVDTCQTEKNAYEQCIPNKNDISGEESLGPINRTKLKDKILSDNTAYADNVSSIYVSSSTGIDFSAISNDTNGKGLYYTATNTEGNQPTYYFRGAVTNNIVQFGQDLTNASCMYNGQKVYRLGRATDGSSPEIREEEIYYETSCGVEGANLYELCYNEWCSIVENDGWYIGEILDSGEYYTKAELIPGAKASWEGTPLYWKIVRINEDGSIRLIYNGTSATATGTSSVLSGTTAYAPATTAMNAYVGYMYGSTNFGITYADTHANTNFSKIKTVLDNWYFSNLETKYEKYIADSGFCNDRSLYSGTGIYNATTVYKGHNRIYTIDKPQFACPNPENDLFTLDESGKGNEALSRPVGLLTADEAMYAGAIYNSANSTYYLYNGVNYWTMTPQRYYSSSIRVFNMGSTGRIYYTNAGTSSSMYARPVINLKEDVLLTDELPSGCTEQIGTASCPYVVDTTV